MYAAVTYVLRLVSTKILREHAHAPKQTVAIGSEMNGSTGLVHQFGLFEDLILCISLLPELMVFTFEHTVTWWPCCLRKFAALNPPIPAPIITILSGRLGEAACWLSAWTPPVVANPPLVWPAVGASCPMVGLMKIARTGAKMINVHREGHDMQQHDLNFI